MRSAEEVVRDLALLPVSAACAKLSGRLMRDLRVDADKGTVRRHAVECVVAATALDRGAAVATGDVVFIRLAVLEPGLRVTDWTAV